MSRKSVTDAKSNTHWYCDASVFGEDYEYEYSLTPENLVTVTYSLSEMALTWRRTYTGHLYTCLEILFLSLWLAMYSIYENRRHLGRAFEGKLYDIDTEADKIIVISEKL